MFIKQISASYNSSLLLFYPQKNENSQIYQWGHGSCTPCRVYINKSRKKKRRNSGDLECSSWFTCGEDSKVMIVQVACGEHHNVALSSVGGVYTWGIGNEQLGHGPEENIYVGNSPKLIESLLPENGGGKAVHVAATSNRTAVVSDVGDLYVWGSTDEQGILSPGYEKYQPIPKRVMGIKKAVAVTVGEDHTIVLTASSLPKLPYQELFEANYSTSIESSNVDTSFDNFDCSFNNDFNLLQDNSDSNNNNNLVNKEQFFSYVPSLKSLCEREVAKGVDTRNVISLLSYSEDSNCTELASYCSEFIVRNLDAILVQNRQYDLELLAGGLADSLNVIKFRSRGCSIDNKESKSRSDSIKCRAGSMDNSNENSTPNDKIIALNTVDSVSKKIRSTKKKINEIETLEKKSMSGIELSKEQLDKCSKKSYLTLEIKRLDLILHRVEGEERIREQAMKSRRDAQSNNSNVDTIKKSNDDNINVDHLNNKNNNDNDNKNDSNKKKNKSKKNEAPIEIQKTNEVLSDKAQSESKVEQNQKHSSSSSSSSSSKKVKYIPLSLFEKKHSNVTQPPSFSDWENILSSSSSTTTTTITPETPKKGSNVWSQSPSQSKNVSMKNIVEQERARTSSIGLPLTPSKPKVESTTISSSTNQTEITLGSFIVTPKKKSDVQSHNSPWSNTPNNKSNKSLSQIQEEELRNINPINNNNNNAWFCVRPRAESLDTVISEQLVEKAIEIEKNSLNKKLKDHSKKKK